MDTLVGRRLGKYQIESLVGRGGMAAVYRAHDTALNRSVAIKVLEPALAIDPKSVERFRREAVTAANLEHPSIVRVYDVQQESGVHYIAMRYVHGTTLRSIMRDNGPMPLEAILNVIKPVASALHYAHKHGVIHRDVKPGNILVEPDGTVLLTDFGIARAAGGSQSALTTTGQVMGTADYLAPEQIIGRPAEARSDTYSLGVVLYEMLTGVTPFGGENTASILYRQVHDTPTPIRSINPRLPIELQSVVDRALAKNPSTRYADPLDLARDLEDVTRRLPPGSPWLANKPDQQATIAISENKRPSGSLYPPPTARPAPPQPARNNANKNERAEVQSPKSKVQSPPQVLAPPNTGRRSIWTLMLAVGLLLAGGVLLAMAAGIIPGFGGSDTGGEGRFQPPGAPTPTVFLRKGNGADIYVPRALIPLKIDGDLADWEGSSPNPVSKLIPTLRKRPLKGPEDLSANFYFAWDANNFYIGAIITDNVHVSLTNTQGYDLYKGDDIEIWFDINLEKGFTKSKGENEDDVYELGLSAGNFANLKPEAVFWWPKRLKVTNNPVRVAALPRSENNGYTLEAYVPWQAFGTFRPQPGQAIGFAASAGDCDAPSNPHQEIMLSTTTKVPDKDPTNFGNLFF